MHLGAARNYTLYCGLMNTRPDDYYMPSKLFDGPIGSANELSPTEIDSLNQSVENKVTECASLIYSLWLSVAHFGKPEELWQSLIKHADCYAIFYFGFADAFLQSDWHSRKQHFSTDPNKYYAELSALWVGVYAQLMSSLGVFSGKRVFDRNNPTLPFSNKRFVSHMKLACKVNFSHPQFHLRMLGGNVYLHLEKTETTDDGFWNIKKIIEEDELASSPPITKGRRALRRLDNGSFVIAAVVLLAVIYTVIAVTITS